MISDNFDPKKSIREYVNEEELKFELMMMNLSIKLKNIETMEEDEVVEQFNKDRQKRIDYYKKTLNNHYEGKEGKELPDVGVKGFEKNIIYMENLDVPLTRDDILKDFEPIKKAYGEYLETCLEDEEISQTKRAHIYHDIEYVNGIALTSSYSKEHFGKMLMLIIRNLAVKPSFSGYTDNWKDEFFGNAIEKVLLYSRNFDENLLSKRTGAKSKAFAYITMICYNAFIAIINERNAGERVLKDIIPYHTIEGYKQFPTEQMSTDKELYANNDYIIEYSFNGSDENDIIDFIEYQLRYIKSQNEIISKNKFLKGELKYVEKTTPDDQKGKEYIAYLRDIEMSIEPQEFILPKTTLKILYPENEIIPTEIMHKIINIDSENINVTLMRDIQKIDKTEFLHDMEADIKEIEDEIDFCDEW